MSYATFKIVLFAMLGLNLGYFGYIGFRSTLILMRVKEAPLRVLAWVSSASSLIGIAMSVYGFLLLEALP